MAVPTTRESFKTYCLRRLGEPVVDVNVDDDQVEDRIDDALAFYRDYHYDGTERVLIQHQVTATDKTNKYISCLLYTSPSPRDRQKSRMPSSA